MVEKRLEPLESARSLWTMTHPLLQADSAVSNRRLLVIRTGRSRKSAPAVSSVVRYWTSEAGPNARGLQKAFAYVSPRDQQASLAREISRLGVIRDCMDNDASDTDRIGGMHDALCGVSNHRAA